jgi:hypothetical protein
MVHTMGVPHLYCSSPAEALKGLKRIHYSFMTRVYVASSFLQSSVIHFILESKETEGYFCIKCVTQRNRALLEKPTLI